MTTVVTRARAELLAREKELTRARDAVSAARRALPKTEIIKGYAFGPLALVSRVPLASIERFQKRMGWTVPWYSSEGTDFNTDFGATVDGNDVPGASVFLRDGERVYHTYSTFWRGADLLLTTYNYLDLTPLGRQRYVTEFPHHDRY
jgi:predicted dithiol-disulfide oxidoreductase (DUF899 family)